MFFYNNLIYRQIKINRKEMLSSKMTLVEFFVSAFFWVRIHCTIILQCQTEQKLRVLT